MMSLLFPRFGTLKKSPEHLDLESPRERAPQLEDWTCNQIGMQNLSQWKTTVLDSLTHSSSFLGVSCWKIVEHHLYWGCSTNLTATRLKAIPQATNLEKLPSPIIS